MKLLIALYHPFVLWNAPEWLAPRLREEFPGVEVVQLPGPRYEGIESEITYADAAIAWSIRPEQFAHARRLRWVHSPAAAVHQLMFPAMVESDVVLTNARTVHAPVVAEHILALMFAMAKRLPQATRFQRDHVWGQQQVLKESSGVREISGSTVCLIGMGSIGREFAKRAKALGVGVIAVRQHPERGTDGAHEVRGIDQLDSVLPLADFVVLAAPLTENTEHIINAARLAKMRPTAYLVNVGRGPLVDDAALVDALQANRIAGAALDVFPVEPLPADSPYWDLPNVLITPHTAAVTGKLWERHHALIADNLQRFLAGQPLLNVVDKKQGY